MAIICETMEGRTYIGFPRPACLCLSSYYKDRELTFIENQWPYDESNTSEFKSIRSRCLGSGASCNETD